MISVNVVRPERDPCIDDPCIERVKER